MAKWTSYYKIVTPRPEHQRLTDSQALGDAGAYNNYTWYQRLVQGSASRLTRYREYDLMDGDVEVSRAIDTIAEEMTGNNPKTDEPLELKIQSENEDNVDSKTVLTLKAALRRWGEVHDWRNRLFKSARITIKYGDCFFRKQDKHQKWVFIHPKNVIAAIVDKDDITKVIAWQLKVDPNQARGQYSQPLQGKDEHETEIVPADQVVRFTLNDELSDSAPFGESVLRPVYRSHKQKELLEDAIIIYRVQRAPERRVFYVDVGKMPPQRVKQYLEGIKNEIKQKKVPTFQGGRDQIDSVYNPQSMSEDFFFAARPDGRGSRVETLPGGQGLGELEDLYYFQRKVWRGLRVPASYMVEQNEGGAVFSDNKIGVAYIQELRFTFFVERLQNHIETVLDQEFKRYLKQAGIYIDESIYQVRLPEPSNFAMYKQQAVDSDLLNSFSSAESIPYLSKRFILKRYLRLTDDEIITNERLVREEKGIDPEESEEQSVQLVYGATAEDGMDMGMGGFGGGMGMGDLGGGIGGESMGMGGGAPMGGPVGGAGGAGGAGGDAGGGLGI